MLTHEHFMREALKQASYALEEGEVPVGAVLVWGEKIIARGYNQTERLKDPTAHAEMLAITSATHSLGTKYLQDCILYVTLEPCIMCAGAMYWAQLGGVVFGAYDPKRGFLKEGKHLLHPKANLEGGILAEPCKALLDTFFKGLRN
jgi:tRNA(adenine34) deaminase